MGHMAPAGVTEAGEGLVVDAIPVEDGPVVIAIPVDGLVDAAQLGRDRARAPVRRRHGRAGPPPAEAGMIGVVFGTTP